ALVVPTIDTELFALAQQCQQFADRGARIVISRPDVVRMARDKLETMHWLATQGISTPVTIPMVELVGSPGTWRWPVILKPCAGSSSHGIHMAIDPITARSLPIERNDYLAQEFWSGSESTVNMFFD